MNVFVPSYHKKGRANEKQHGVKMNGAGKRENVQRCTQGNLDREQRFKRTWSGDLRED